MAINTTNNTAPVYYSPSQRLVNRLRGERAQSQTNAQSAPEHAESHTHARSIKYEESRPRLGQIVVDKGGQFIIDGKRYSLLGLIFRVLQEASLQAKNRLGIAVQDLEDANKKAKDATQFLNFLRAQKPESSKGKTNGGDFNTAYMDLKASLGFQPDDTSLFDRFGIADMKHQNGVYNQTEVDKVIEGTKSYLSTVNSDQQRVQLDTQRYTHASDEMNEAMSSIEKSISNAIESEISKI